MTTPVTPAAPGGTDAGLPQQPPAAPAPPAGSAPATNPPAPQPGGQPTAQATVGQPADGDAPKTITLTQAELDKMIGDRLERDRASQRKQFAAAFGITEPGDGDGKPSADEVLAQAQKVVQQAQTRANVATARAYAQGEVKPERVDALLGMLDVKAVLANVDANDPAAVDAAIKAAVAAKAAEFPEWKPGPALPGSSTANPSQPQGNGKRTYTRAELDGMSQDELAKVADDLVAAAREGRIK